MMQIIGTGYLWALIGLTEITAGVLLILNKWKGFALIILAPISLNIILCHLNFDISEMGPGLNLKHCFNSQSSARGPGAVRAAKETQLARPHEATKIRLDGVLAGAVSGLALPCNMHALNAGLVRDATLLGDADLTARLLQYLAIADGIADGARTA